MAHAFQSRFQLALKVNQSRSVSAVDAAALLDAAIDEAIADGVDPWSDPAVVLIIVRLAVSADLGKTPRELFNDCASRGHVQDDPPLLLKLLCHGLDADPRREAQYVLEVEHLLRALAAQLRLPNTEDTVRLRPGPACGDAIAVLEARWLHLRVCASPPPPGLGLVYRRADGLPSDERAAPLEALCDPRQLAQRIDLALRTPRDDEAPD